MPLAHLFLRERVKPGDRVVDATCGNGNDTLLMARLVGPNGKVLAFDLQEEALAATRTLLAGAGVEDRVELVSAGHERLAEVVGEPLAAVVFNLGYLPGGDKGIITRPATTIAALNAALEILLPGGLLLMVIYTGHTGAAAEEETVLSRVSALDPRTYNVWTSRQANRPPTAPYLVVVEKSGP